MSIRKDKNRSFRDEVNKVSKITLNQMRLNSDFKEQVLDYINKENISFRTYCIRLRHSIINRD